MAVAGVLNTLLQLGGCCFSGTFIFHLYFYLLSEPRGYGHHRCVTHLYRIPMWIFDCILDMRLSKRHRFGSFLRSNTEYYKNKNSRWHRIFLINASLFPPV